MVSGLLISLMCMIVPPQYTGAPLQVPGGASAAVKMRCTCYLPTGYNMYDGTPCYEGAISSNKEHVGKVAFLYTLDGELIGRFECHDIGGNSMLRNGTAIDVYRDNMDRALEWVATYGDYVLVEWRDN